MNYQSYSIKCSADKCWYWFHSKGKTEIIKVLQFQKMDVDNRYNLAMADWINNSLNFDNRSGNDDLPKILGSVVEIVEDFMHNYPNAEIYIEGNTPAKTRLYQMEISKNLEEISRHFNIYGLKEAQGDFFNFTKGRNYIGFLVTHK